MVTRNQRSIITPDHFVVAPEILGVPLANPGRRAYAMAIDLVLIALLVKSGGVFLGVVAAIVLFRASRNDPQSGFLKKSVRNALRILSAIILFVVIRGSWSSIRERVNGKDRDDDVVADSAVTMPDGSTLNLNFQPGDIKGLAGAFIGIARSDDSAGVEKAAVQLLEKGKKAGATRADLDGARAELISMMGEEEDSSKVRAIDAAIAKVARTIPPPTSPDTVLRRYLRASASGDSAAIAAYRDSLKSVVAGKELTSLDTRVKFLDARADSLDKELDKAHKARGFRSFIEGAADDLGVGFGWSAVYFTAFLALWRGQTPGKKVAGVRVLRLDGKPLGWWMSFERFGGYAASLSVGLLGFLQILWDRNRQGLHDKACETVVVFAKSAGQSAPVIR